MTNETVRLTHLPSGYYRMSEGGDTYATIFAMDPPTDHLAFYHIHIDGDPKAEPHPWTLDESDESVPTFHPISEADARKVSPALARHLDAIDRGEA